MRMLVFLHGTIIMHKNAAGLPRGEIVRQAVGKDASVHDYASYIPIGNAAGKLQAWKRQAAEILYLSSHRDAGDVEKDRLVLNRHGFPDAEIFYRKAGEEYKDVAERLVPDVLVEDDCESIGGEKEMVYPHITPRLKARIKSIVVREFGGIDRLPDDILRL